MVLAAAIFSLSSAAPRRCWAQDNTTVGIFESHGDVGTVLHPGSVAYDAVKKDYTVTGSGENMWLGADAFQFVWKKISGDATLTADVSFVGSGGNEHRKAVLMFRQNLDADSTYVDIALHGNGMTALQFRSATGALTQEIIANISAPKRLSIAKRGDYVYMSLAGDGEKLHLAGGWMRVPLRGVFYAGIGVCSHNKDVSEKAGFSRVDLAAPAPAPAGQATLYSTLERVGITSSDRQVVYIAPGRFEAPNWTRDGKSFLFNRGGHIERLPVSGGEPEIIPTGAATDCNNDHGISPDGAQLAISDSSQEKHDSLVYIVAASGGVPRRITENSPSYWHGWSPDGKTLAFVGQRNGDFDIYTIPAEQSSASAVETRLTSAKGLDDGPEYSPDGNYIYFNSERTGTMQIWRMLADGSKQEQVFVDDYNNWFPHISPDGQWMVFLTYAKDVTGHPQDKDVQLRAMSLSDKKIRVVATLFGGQGTINVPSWSPDSKQVAFVSYQLLPAEQP
jgi:hypothetical protein